MIVAIDGFGASGKSSLAAKLAAQCHGQVICLDDFARPGTPTWEHERFIDEVLTPLRAGCEAVYHRWRHDAPVSLGQARVEPSRPVFVEGVSALALGVVERVGRWWDLSLWLEVDEATRRRRIAKRDTAALMACWEQQWWPSERRYFTTEHPLTRADFVVRGSRPAHSLP